MSEIDLLNKELNFNKQILESVQNAIIVTNLKGEITFWNSSAEKLYLWKKEEVLGKNIIHVTPSKTSKQQATEIMQLLSHGETWEGEFEVQDKNGREFFIHVIDTPLLDNNNNLVGIIGVSRDISKEREKRFNLQESEEKFRSLYNSAPLPYQSLNEDGSFKDVNQAWLNILGYKREEVIGKYYKDFLHPDWKAHFEKNFPAFKKRGYVHDVQFKIRHKNGNYIDISFEGCIGYHPDGSFKQTYCVFQDITEEKLYQEILERNQYFLRKAQEIGKIGTWELDVIENNLYWTKENYQIFGVEPGTKMNYEGFLKIVHPDDRAYVNKKWQDAIAGKPYEINHRLLIGETIKWVKEKADLKFDEKGNVISAIGVTQDITSNIETQ